MRKVTLILFILRASSVWANSCVAMAIGNSNAAGTWTSCGGTFPGSGDTASIGSAFVVTIPAGITMVAGTSGATGTAAVTLSGTAQLIITGTLDSRGVLIQKLGTT